MTRFVLGGVLSGMLVLWLPVTPAREGVDGRRRQLPVEVGNRACKPCHEAIYDSYSRTAMARTSGPALPELIEGSFDHAPSRVSYRILRRGDAGILSYDRAGSPGLHGSQVLKYYIGSKTRGRTFLFDIDGFLYQAPINYYTAKNGWEMSPGYSQLREMELNHPVDSTCLFCHASRVQPTLKGTLNRFAAEAFLQDGVGCERCHGRGSDHIKGLDAMINPSKLTGERRDSICIQCHLEGEARIPRASGSQEHYQPGEQLSKYVAIFVREDNAKQRRGAVSQVESLAVSRCKVESGDRLSCLTCHDPHVQPTAEARAGYYRDRCVGCHAGMAERHYSRQQDCTACHMPRTESADIAHTAVTDHRITREPRNDGGRSSEVRRLVQFGNARPTERDLGLAYGEVALRDNAFAAAEAFRLLEAVRQLQPDDLDVLTRLGYLHQARGDFAIAEKLYEEVQKRDPDHAVAAANLGVFYARRGMLRQALELWRTTFENNPQLSEIGVNLGRGLCAVGDADGARTVLQRVLKHNPDMGVARLTLTEIARRGCAERTAQLNGQQSAASMALTPAAWLRNSRNTPFVHAKRTWSKSK
jgi:predicted CXXCH cytochrome family protein